MGEQGMEDNKSQDSKWSWIKPIVWISVWISGIIGFVGLIYIIYVLIRLLLDGHLPYIAVNTQLLRDVVSSLVAWAPYLGFLFHLLSEAISWLVVLFSRVFMENKFPLLDDNGDVFNVFIALFSGLAFAGVMGTFLSQRKEFKETQNTQKKQRFENTLFQMIRLYHEIVGEIDTKNFPEDGSIKCLPHTKGKKAMKVLYEKHLEDEKVESLITDMDEIIKNNNHCICTKYNIPKGQSEKNRLTFQKVKNMFNDILYQETDTQFQNIKDMFNDILCQGTDGNIRNEIIRKSSLFTFGLIFFFDGEQFDIFHHCMRLLYHIFKFIHTSDIDIKDKQKYVSIVRAQLSKIESKILLANVITYWVGHPKFLYLCKEYDILKHTKIRNDIPKERSFARKIFESIDKEKLEKQMKDYGIDLATLQG